MQNRKLQDKFFSTRVELSVRDRIWAALLGAWLPIGQVGSGQTELAANLPLARTILSIWQAGPAQASLPPGLSSAAQLVAIATLLLRYHDNMSQRIDRILDLGPPFSSSAEQIWQTLMLGELIELALENQPLALAWTRLGQMPARYGGRSFPRAALSPLPSAYQNWLEACVLPSAERLPGDSGPPLKPAVDIPLVAALSRCFSNPQGYAVNPSIEAADRGLAMLTGLLTGAFGGPIVLPVHWQLAIDTDRLLLQAIADRLFRQWAGIQPELADPAAETTAVFSLL
ncbi:hypothetical protein IQ241_21140 [Romeria aff. gracilis LEGE 07310]|uniref:Uncharacterized protein n=1 Tax=Vasconcelosia minhoensis LEGE 07310 TaxID=915328 RepID=A0A8J7AIM6_9CYAN|nr:hypothetical protein [Romeria gracilis]MBE9079766.1 hypothetical protein [Romeria aff. gracilis LEGE 07310]